MGFTLTMVKPRSGLHSAHQGCVWRGLAGYYPAHLVLTTFKTTKGMVFLPGLPRATRRLPQCVLLGAQCTDIVIWWWRLTTAFMPQDKKKAG